jgi:hypothetical protein
LDAVAGAPVPSASASSFLLFPPPKHGKQLIFPFPRRLPVAATLWAPGGRVRASDDSIRPRGAHAHTHGPSRRPPTPRADAPASQHRRAVDSTSWNAMPRPRSPRAKVTEPDRSRRGAWHVAAAAFAGSGGPESGTRPPHGGDGRRWQWEEGLGDRGIQGPLPREKGDRGRTPMEGRREGGWQAKFGGWRQWTERARRRPKTRGRERAGRARI